MQAEQESHLAVRCRQMELQPAAEQAFAKPFRRFEQEPELAPEVGRKRAGSQAEQEKPEKQAAQSFAVFPFWLVAC